MKRRAAEILFLMVILTVPAGVMVALAPAGLYSNEEGVLVVQMKNFALNGSLEVAGPGQKLGFSPADVAGQDSLFEARDGRLYAITPPMFPWITSLFYPLFGERAVDVAPVLFLLLSALILGLILDRFMERNVLYWLLLAAYLVGSPVFLQGLLFSGMTLALLLILSALWLMAGHFSDKPSMAKLFSASILLGISVFIRLECIVIALSFYLGAAIVLAVQKRKQDLLAVLAACSVSACFFVLHDVVLHGRFPGSYLQVYLPFYSLSPIRVAVLGFSLTASIFLILLSGRKGITPVPKAILSILSVTLVFSAVLLTAARISIAHLMAVFPAVLFAFYGVPERLERLKKGEGTLEGILAATVAVSLALGAAILQPGQWIVFLAWLPTVPFVVLILALERKTVFSSAGMSLVLAFFCGVAFVNGIQESKDRFVKYKDYNAARVEFIASHTSAGDAIFFVDTANMEHAGPLFFDRVFLLVRNPDDQERLARQLRDRHISGIYAWTINPMDITGFHPYGGSALSFPLPPGSKSCCGSVCRERNFHLVRLDTEGCPSHGSGLGGS